MPVLYIFPASQVVKIKPKINSMPDIQICSIGTPNGILIIIVTGEVNGIIDSQMESALSGWFTTTPDIITEKISGMETGSMNCWLSES